MSTFTMQPSRILVSNSAGPSTSAHQQEAITHSPHQARRCIDFISESPYDILCVIVAFFDQDTMVTCIDVCRAWREILLGCPVPWLEMNIHNSKHVALLSVISRYVNKLSIYDNEDCIKLIRTLNLSHLQSLAIVNECM